MEVSRGIALIRTFQQIYFAKVSSTIYVSFDRPHRDYSGVIYDQAYSVSFNSKTKLHQLWWCSFSDNWGNERFIKRDVLSRIRFRDYVNDVGYTDCVFSIRNIWIYLPFIFRLMPTTSRMYITWNNLKGISV